jgi:hypothetical protein
MMHHLPKSVPPKTMKLSSSWTEKADVASTGKGLAANQ